MSRIGKIPVSVPEKVEVKIEKNNVIISGEKGKLNFVFSDQVDVKFEDSQLIVIPLNDGAKALWGTTRSILSNMIEGVTNGFTKSLEINGVGYKFEPSGKKLVLAIGFSHKVEMDVPEGLAVTADDKQKNVIHITGIDKQRVGQFASKIKSQKKPEPYKGKGIKYLGEHIRRKAGKTGAK